MDIREVSVKNVYKMEGGGAGKRYNYKLHDQGEENPAWISQYTVLFSVYLLNVNNI